LSGRGLCDELITRPEESYRLCCVVVCDLETSRIGAPYIYDISNLRVKKTTRNIIKRTCSGRREARWRTTWKKRFFVQVLKPQHHLTSHADISHVVEYTNSINHKLRRKASCRMCVTVHMAYFNLKPLRRLNSIKCCQASRGCWTREHFTEDIFRSCRVSEHETSEAMWETEPVFEMLWCKKGKTMDNVLNVAKHSLHRPRETLRAPGGWGSRNF